MIRILRAAVGIHHEAHAAGFVVNVEVGGLRIWCDFLLEAAEEVLTHHDRPIAGHGAGWRVVIIGRIDLHDVAEVVVLIAGGGINAAAVGVSRFIGFARGKF
jgi:hypothetical protein